MPRTGVTSAELHRLVRDAVNAALGEAGAVQAVLLEIRKSGEWRVLAVSGDVPREALDLAIPRAVRSIEAQYVLVRTPG